MTRQVTRVPRGLSPDEAELWAKVAATVTPIPGRKIPSSWGEGVRPKAGGEAQAARPKSAKSRPQAIVVPPQNATTPKPPLVSRLDQHGLDSSWERKLAKAAIQPDFTLDLHGHTLDTAHARLEMGLTQALAQGARLVLLVTGRPRPSDDHAGRSDRRGAIRAKMLDWLAAGPHASKIAAVRPAHPRHGGAGAVYIVLRRPR
jgi:DNA-nicking Smr family endonuclease